MTTTTAYQCDEQGKYIGETVVQEDPMEPGTFLLPPNAYLDTPPQFGAEQQAIRNGESWEVVEIPAIEVPDVAPVGTASEEQLLHAFKAEVAAALAASDIVLLRCYEVGMAAPADWVAYRRELRSYLSLELGAALPTISKPAYPDNLHNQAIA